MSMLPLEVLPGWPEPEPVSNLTVLLLTIVGPIGFGLIVALIVFAPRLTGKAKDGASTELAHRDH
ncbi:MAG: hypothetical protein QM713_14950 [Arachnia sp.]